jgi:hypothetical protein
MMFPVGRLLPEGVKPAVMHGKIGELNVAARPESSIKIFIQVSSPGEEPDREDWPVEPIMVFEGYITGMGFSRTRAKAQLVLHARNWLSDLAYGSCLSAQSHPANPADFLMPAKHLTRTGANVNATAQVSFFPLWIDLFMNELVLQNDFWLGTGGIAPGSPPPGPPSGPQGPQGGGGGSQGTNLQNTPSAVGSKDGLHDWFMRISQEDFLDVDRLSTRGVGAAQGGVKKVINDTMRRALLRMEGGRCYVPLKLDVLNNQFSDITACISESLSLITFKSFGSNTIWNKLITEFCPAYMMAIVPLVEIAYPIPYVPGLRQCYTTIKGTEYVAIDVSSQMERLLRAVCVLGSRTTNTRGEHNLTEKPGAAQGLTPPRPQTIGGFFSPPNVEEGLIMMKMAPSWLNNIVVSSTYAPGTTNRGGTTSNALDPDAGIPPTQQDPFTLRPVQYDMMTKYAESFYVYEMLKGRTGAVSGKFRLDIAPGSIVKVEGPREPFIVQDELGDDFYATVTGVTVALDAQAAIAGTTFQLAHIRTEKENQRPGFSIDRSPLWKDPWNGCSLVKEVVPGHPNHPKLPNTPCPPTGGPQGGGGGPQGPQGGGGGGGGPQGPQGPQGSRTSSSGIGSGSSFGTGGFVMGAAGADGKWVLNKPGSENTRRGNAGYRGGDHTLGIPASGTVFIPTNNLTWHVGGDPYPGGEDALLLDAQKLIDNYDPRPNGPGDRGKVGTIGIPLIDPATVPQSGFGGKPYDPPRYRPLSLAEAKRLARVLAKYRNPPGTPRGDAILRETYHQDDGAIVPKMRWVSRPDLFSGGFYLSTHEVTLDPTKDGVEVLITDKQFKLTRSENRVAVRAYKKIVPDPYGPGDPDEAGRAKRAVEDTYRQNKYDAYVKKYGKYRSYSNSPSAEAPRHHMSFGLDIGWSDGSGSPSTPGGGGSPMALELAGIISEMQALEALTCPNHDACLPGVPLRPSGPGFQQYPTWRTG